MSIVIADASVVVKWFLEEEDTAAARRLREDFFEGLTTLRAPGILVYEVVSALRTWRRQTRVFLLGVADALDRAAITTVPLVGDYLMQTVETALARRVTVCDASYVALAAIHRCPLYTADEEIVALGDDRVRILHIRDYPDGST